MKNNNHLNLSPPPRHKPKKGSIEYRPRVIKHWLSNLPITNLGSVSSAILDAIKQVNQLQISPSARLRFQELVRPYIQDTVTALELQAPPKAFPQPEINRDLEQSASALLVELAIGYYSVVKELETSKRRRRSRQMALATQRTIHTLGRLLTHNVSRYQLPPQQLWHYLHSLYQTAEHDGIATTHVPDPLLKQQRHPSIANTYKQILLLSAVGPYRMRVNEIAAANQLLERWAPACQLFHVDTNLAEVTFFVDLNTDKPPFYQRIDIHGSQSIRLLDTSPLADLASSEKQARRWWQFRRPAIQAHDPELVQRLIISLGMPPVRQSIRLPASASVQVLIGLSQIHRGLMALHNLTTLTPNDDQPTFQGRDLSTSLHWQDNVWELIYPRDLLQRLRTEEQAPTARSMTPQPPKQDWQLINASHGGYCLLSDPKQVTKAQINELIALYESSDNSRSWQLGTIRWMRQHSDGLQIGVQILGSDPIPAQIQLKHGKESAKTADRALLLDANEMAGQPATLLTTPLRYEAQQSILLAQPAHKRAAVLTQQIESCSGFAQFEYKLATQPATADAAK